MPARPVVLVTAGSAGLGAAASRLFASRGFVVAVNYSANTTRANQLITELNATRESVEDDAKHMAIQADLSLCAEVERLVEDVYKAMGRVDVIFSNVGWTQFRDTTRLEDNAFEEDWDRAYTMNVKSHLWLLKAAEKYLQDAEGCFITTSSLAGIRGMGSSLAYSVSKAAQIHLVKGLAAMVDPKIRVNTISPGLMETDWSKRFSEEQKDQHKSQTKLNRFVRVEDVAEQVFSLANNRSITGVNLPVDAGFLL